MIPNFPVVKFGHSFTVVPNRVNVVSSADDPTYAALPSAKSAGNGAWFAIKCLGTGGVAMKLYPGDTLDGGAGQPHDIASDRDCQVYVSDGVSTWILIANVKFTLEGMS